MARFRNKTLKVMVTEEEYLQVKRKMESIGITNMSAFLRMLLKYGKAYNLNSSSFDSLIYEINKIGVNINQIAKKANQTGSVCQSDIAEINSKLDYITQLVFQKFGIISKVERGEF